MSGTSPGDTGPGGASRRRWWPVIPVLAFAALVVVLYRGFSLEDAHKLPSALIDQPFPAFALPTLDGRQVDQTSLQGVALVNVWATWCPTCKAEHAELLRIQRESGVPIYGVFYKDAPANGRQWLAMYGDPYVFNVVDEGGQLGVNLGVYGAPETFLVDAGGIIRYKRVGDVNRRVWDEEIVPKLRELGVEPADAAPPTAAGGSAR